MTIAYFDCPTGISGDMCLGALVSAGVPLEYLQQIIQQLGCGDQIQLTQQLVHRQGQIATQVKIELAHEHHHRHLSEIEQIIQTANLPSQIEAWSLASFRCLAAAEAAVHGISIEAVHFHEVGALDAIADIVCTCAGLVWLGVEQIHSSSLPTGGGYVNCAHGRLPVPAPAVLKLWETHHIPVFSNGIAAELVTPTGAAILSALTTEFGEVPPMQIETVGLGAGTKDFNIPNILRLWLGQPLAVKKKVHPHP
ncbi:MAG: nickel pincer cofactor biosynthesis protein LarC [Pseudanabaenaceae cyanobacterium bins.68]|nr:nickel pincer cofactor biosynthesis protein LarC [Pseudanabaenaceae cyanobacterium bins.68]